MKPSRRKVFFVLTAALWFGAVLLLQAATTAAQDPSALLRGLKSVYLNVEPLDASTVQKGMEASELRKDAEKALRKAGIKLLSNGEYQRFRRSASYPMARLDLQVMIQEIPIGQEVLNVNRVVVQARQQAFLSRKPAISLLATTWRRDAIHYSNDLEEVYDMVRSFVQEFISAYQSANR